MAVSSRRIVSMPESPREGVLSVGSAVKLARTGSSQDFQSSIRTLTSQDCEFDISNLLIIHKKRLDLPENRGVDVAETRNFRIQQRLLCNGNESWVFLPFLLFLRIGFQDADQPAFQQAARKCGLVHEDQDVNRISIIALCGRNKTEIVWKHHSFRQNFGKLKHSQIGIIFEFVPASLGRFNDDLHAIFCRYTEALM